MKLSSKVNFFSVIIPLYNKKPHILRSVNSVLSQEYKFFELIVIDDGSTDGGVDLLSSIKDERLRIFRKHNGGASSARNCGINKSKYDLISFLDADDEYDKNFLTYVNDMVNFSPRAGVFTTGCRIVGGLQNSVKRVDTAPGIFKVEDYFKLYNKLHCTVNNSSTTVVKKKLLFQVGLFPEEQIIYEDWTVWFSLALISDVVYSNFIGSTIHQDAVNRSYNKNDTYVLLENLFLLICRVEAFIFKYYLDRKNLDRTLSQIIQGIINRAVKDKNFDLLKAIKKLSLHKYLTFFQIILLKPYIFPLLVFLYPMIKTLKKKIKN